jgi:quercetin 2,3-dioxygenase
VPVASGMAKHRGAAVSIHKRYAAQLQPGRSVELPEAPYLHLFVPRGTVTLEGAGELRTGDAVRFTATEAPEVLVWEMHATVAA